MHAGYGDAGDTGYIVWKTLASVCEVKYRSHSHLDLDARLQIADKAVFTLSSQLDRWYFVGLSLCGPELRVLLFSRGGSAITAPIDIHADPLQFMYVLAIFSLGHLSWLGYDDHILVAPGDSLILKFADNAYKIIQPLFAANADDCKEKSIKKKEKEKAYYCRHAVLDVDGGEHGWEWWRGR